MQNILKIIIISSVLFISITPLALADNLSDPFGTPLTQVAGTDGAGYKTDDADPAVLVGKIIKAALSFVGIIFLVLMIYGGYTWMMARGNEQEVEKAKNLITAAIIGLIIVLAAYAISYFILEKIGGETFASNT